MSATLTERRLASLKAYPALSIGLTQEQFDASVPGYKIASQSDHQFAAAKMAAAQLKWHSKYVMELAPVARPPILPTYSEIKGWAKHCERWQAEHDMSVDALAQHYVQAFESCDPIRVYEPIEWRQGVRVSTHDLTPADFPSFAVEWDVDQ